MKDRPRTEMHAKLLGTPQITQNEQRVDSFVTKKAEALLFYLITTRRRHSRDALASLLWPQVADRDAATSLRRALSTLRKLVPDALDITRQTVAVNAERLTVDVWEFEDSAENDPSHAATCYTANFLSSYNVTDAQPFNDWVTLQRERLRLLAIGCLQTTASQLKSTDRPAAIATLQRLIHIEPYGEANHRDLMLLLAQTAQYEAALTQYQHCAQVLADELKLTPVAATTTLRDRIERARSLNRDNLPAQPTPLIGRKTDLQNIQRALTTSRLITLHGSGGSGKTRLAIALAHAKRHHYLDGVHFIPLSTLTDPTQLPITILRHLVSKPLGNPSDHLVNHLKPQHALLILDNFEQLVTNQSVNLITSLLQFCPNLHILTTSRHRLQSRWETTIPITGLPHAPPTTPFVVKTSPEWASLMDHESAQLFLTSAKRAGRPLPNDHKVAAGVNAICTLVQGIPLALELAAALTPQHAPQTIATQIATTADTLASQYRDLPPRQRSLRATFAYSWQLLTAPEQTLLSQLSIFEGSFSQAAMLAVTDGDMRLLQRLVGKALVNPTGDRYGLHPMVREFSAEFLNLRSAISNLHSQHYATHLQALATELDGNDPAPTLALIDPDLPNIRAGWLHAVQQQNSELLLSYTLPLHMYLEIRGYFQDGIPLFTQALQPFASPQLELALKIRLARFHERLDENAQAIDYGEQALALAYRLEQPQEAIQTLIDLAMAHRRLERHKPALAHLSKAVAIAREYQQPRRLASALSLQAMILQSDGELESAENAARESLKILESMGMARPIAIARHSLAALLLAKVDYSGASELFLTNLAFCERIADVFGQSRTLHQLTRLAIAQQEWQAARRYADQGLDIVSRVNDTLGQTLFKTEIAIINAETS